MNHRLFASIEQAERTLETEKHTDVVIFFIDPGPAPHRPHFYVPASFYVLSQQEYQRRLHAAMAPYFPSPPPRLHRGWTR